MLSAALLVLIILLVGVGGTLLARLDKAANDVAQSDGRAHVVGEVDRLLPQTQCAQCGYPGCRPYAEAIVDGDADIDRCPPGGERTVQALATLLGREVIPLNSALGATKPPLVARIEEQDCIGCALCLPACPVDAIVGANRQMHTVITADCTGCELCLAPCPVDCIVLEAPPSTLEDWRWPAPAIVANGATP